MWCRHKYGSCVDSTRAFMSSCFPESLRFEISRSHSHILCRCLSFKSVRGPLFEAIRRSCIELLAAKSNPLLWCSSSHPKVLTRRNVLPGDGCLSGNDLRFGFTNAECSLVHQGPRNCPRKLYLSEWRLHGWTHFQIATQQPKRPCLDQWSLTFCKPERRLWLEWLVSSAEKTDGGLTTLISSRVSDHYCHSYLE